MKNVSPEMLRDAVTELVAECRRDLRSGKVDVGQVDRGVHAYCEAVAKLPRDEGRLHAPDLGAMMELITGLSNDLVAARDLVKGKLQALGELRRANVAYQTSDAVGGKFKKPQGGS